MNKHSMVVLTVLLLIISSMGLLFIFYSSGIRSNACNTGTVFTVQMNRSGFSPKEFSVEKCTKVVFENSDTKPRWPASDFHPTHGIYPEFDPQKEIHPGESWSYVFDKAGSWKFHDHMIPAMRGRITVTK